MRPWMRPPSWKRSAPWEQLLIEGPLGRVEKIKDETKGKVGG